MQTVEMVFLSIIIGGVSIIIFGLTASSLMDAHTKNKAKKTQHLMFNQLNKGNCAWCLSGTELKGYIVSYVSYHFSNRTNEVDVICIHLCDTYHYISLTPEEAKSFTHKDYEGKWYTIYNDAKARRDIIEMERNRSVDKVKVVSPEEFQSKLNNEIASLKNVGEQAIKKLEVKLD